MPVYKASLREAKRQRADTLAAEQAREILRHRLTAEEIVRELEDQGVKVDAKPAAIVIIAKILSRKI